MTGCCWGAANDIASAITVRDGRPAINLPVPAFELLEFAPDDRIGYRIIGPDGETLTGYDEIALPSGRRDFDEGFFDGSFFSASPPVSPSCPAASPSGP
ncbi:sensor histidine kinase N-terminal domain-containing protein [Roseibium salinum]|nr:sensor histidine kinase N-terminal domain-containing protein [Roseibium salinum]